MRTFRAGWGLGTVFSLIIVLFIFLYARDHAAGHWGWKALQYVAGAYLLITLGLLALMILLPLLMIVIALLTVRRQRPRRPRVIDVEAKEGRP